MHVDSYHYTLYKNIKLQNYKTMKKAHTCTLISNRTQLYDRKCLLSFKNIRISKIFLRQFRLPVVSIPYAEDVGADIRSRASG